MSRAIATSCASVATDAGLAAAFILDQPAATSGASSRARRAIRSASSATPSALMVDFDATGQVGYEFSVGLGGGVRDGLITNQNKFDRDWDGAWQHAVRETRRPVVRRAADSVVHHQHARVERRTSARSASTQRAICSIATSAMPARASPAKSAVFLSDFRRIEIAQYDAGRELRLRAVRARCISDLVERRHAVQGRRRHHLEAVAESVARGDAESGFRPGRERRAGRGLLRDRNRVHRQAAVLHREPGHFRSAHAGQRPAHLHAPHRRRAG